MSVWQFLWDLQNKIANLGRPIVLKSMTSPENKIIFYWIYQNFIYIYILWINIVRQKNTTLIQNMHGDIHKKILYEKKSNLSNILLSTFTCVQKPAFLCTWTTVNSLFFNLKKDIYLFSEKSAWVIFWTTAS